MNPSISNFAEYARLALETVYTYGKQWRLVLPSLEHAQLSPLRASLPRGAQARDGDPSCDVARAIAREAFVYIKV